MPRLSLFECRRSKSMLPFFDAATHALSWCSVDKNALIALHGKLNIASKVITGFSLHAMRPCSAMVE